MMSLFSVFDPSSYFSISFNWLILLIIFILFPMSYYLIESGYSLSMESLKMMVSNMFNEIALSNNKAIVFVCVGTFLYLMFSNLIGLFPYVFTLTSHPMVTLGWGLILWLSFFLMGWSMSVDSSLAHLVPEGSPLLLAPLLVVVELVSHLIRPFTLAIRLAANMMAGHLIIGLLSKISMISFMGFSSSLALQSILLILEIGVSVIQGFVFSILVLLYALEYY